MTIATATAGSNIAFVKYWGNSDDALRIPMNGSISMTLDNARTETTVRFDPELSADRLILNEMEADARATERASNHLDHIRQLAGVSTYAEIVSSNSFPTGTGIASSASGFAALTMAACGALGLELATAQLSAIARLGSGSASRSIEGGFVEWQPGGRHVDSYATQFAPPDHWDLVDLIAIVSSEHKTVGSTHGHPLAHTSPFYQARLGELHTTLQGVRRAIFDKDLAALGELIEAEAISLHVASMTSTPSVLYWEPGTLTILKALRRWRAEGTAVGYFTLDAGPNVHIITERHLLPALQTRIAALPEVKQTLVCGVGGDARLI